VLAHVVEDLLRGGNAGVGANEDLLQLLPQLVVDAAAVEDAGDAPEPALASAFERLVGALLQLSVERRRLLDDGRLGLALRDFSGGGTAEEAEQRAASLLGSASSRW
jgi:hypothetical protein